MERAITDIDEIRKKHEAHKSYTDNPNYTATHLTISEVDALFAALDEARGKVEKLQGLVDFYDVKLAKALKIASMRSRYPAWNTNYYLEHIEEIEQILKGGGDGL